MLKRLWIFFLVSFLLTLVGCRLFFAEEDTITLLFTSDVRGKLKSVRKPELFLGDLAVLQTLVLREKSNSEHTLLLDAGNFTHDMSEKGRDLYDDFITAKEVMKIYGYIRYDAVTPGDYDLKFGAGFLKTEADRNEIPLVSANIFTKEGAYWFKPFIIYNFERRKILITGLVNPDVKGYDFTVENPYLAIRSILTEAKKENVDVVVVLSHLGYYNDQRFFINVKGVDVVISSHAPDFLQKPYVVGETILLKSTLYGQHLGKLVLKFTGRAPFGFIKRRVVNRKIVRYNLLPVKPTYAKPSPAVTHIIKSFPDYSEYRELTEKCLPCHSDKISRWMRHPHSKEKLGCVYCHSVSDEHLSQPRSFLDRKTTRKVCQKCHDFTEDEIAEILKKAGCGGK